MHRRDFIRNSGLAAATLLAARPLRAAATAERLRVVQIGTAHSHAAEKWLTLQRMPEVCDLAGIWEPDAGRRTKAAGEPEYRGAHWLTETETFGDRSIHAAVVETELPDLLATGQRCLEAGWHLHLDKPPGADLKAFAALQATAAARHLTLQTGYMYRYHPAFQFCLKAAREGWLGNIFAVHGDIGKVIGPNRRAWLAANYGGSLMLLGCHLLDLTVALLGRPDHATAYRRRSYPEHDGFYDNETAVLEYPRAVATIRSLLCEVGGDERRQFVVCGENGTVEILPLEPARLRLTLQKPAGGFKAGAQEVGLPAVTGRYDGQLQDFRAMAAGAPSRVPQFGPAHDFLVQQLLLQVGRT